MIFVIGTWFDLWMGITKPLNHDHSKGDIPWNKTTKHFKNEISISYF